MKRYFPAALAAFLINSCSTEKINLSPVGDVAYSQNRSANDQNFEGKTTEILYSSELTNQISTMPSFKNSAVNEEVTHLKYYIREYVYAVQEYNVTGREYALFHLEKSYKKIQKLRKYLNKDDDETINRYLVRIKGNITKLEDLKTVSDSTATKP